MTGRFEYDLRRGAPEQCSGLVFLKTPKCDSTSIQRVLIRAAMKHNRTFAPKAIDHRHITNQRLMSHIDKYSSHPSHGNIDIWLGENPASTVPFYSVPYSNKQFVGLVRDPGERIKRYWLYGSSKETEDFEDSFQPLNCQGWANCGIEYAKFKRQHPVGNQLPRSYKSMVFWHSSKTNFHHLLHDIQSGKHLFLVAERLDESLIILAAAYGLSLDDVVNPFHNTREGWRAQRSNMEDKALKAWRETQPLEMKLYEMANKALDVWIHVYGEEKFSQDFETLQNLKAAYKEKCKTKTRSESLPLDFSVSNGGVECDIFLRPESDSSVGDYVCSHQDKFSPSTVKMAHC
eukprot:CAMPEP_0117825210 /NCGR_PEP_ID=MMETSP0949-20121206/5352_1 /TAXON_ID=44440 /ORGANISM="Chattonella subsalsa, Strain CCMP2191" /LENGTH=345 /DNA_ID=CAMNT_0005665161 /DNA_START=291 /DNA_END=1328 /DNA_ORIENTATION=+